MHVTQTRCNGYELNASAVTQDQIRHAMQGSFAFTLRCWETTPVGKNQHQGTGKETLYPDPQTCQHTSSDRAALFMEGATKVAQKEAPHSCSISDLPPHFKPMWWV